MLSIQAKLLVENENFLRFGKKDPKKQQDKINSKKKKKSKNKKQTTTKTHKTNKQTKTVAY